MCSNSILSESTCSISPLCRHSFTKQGFRCSEVHFKENKLMGYHKINSVPTKAHLFTEIFSLPRKKDLCSIQNIRKTWIVWQPSWEYSFKSNKFQEVGLKYFHLKNIRKSTLTYKSVQLDIIGYSVPLSGFRCDFNISYVQVCWIFYFSVWEHCP